MTHTPRWTPRALTTLVAMVLMLGALSPEAQAQEVDERRVEAVIRELDATEPSVEEVTEAAMRFYDLDEDTLDSIESRAGWKAAVPRVSAEARLNSLGTDVDKFDFIQFPDEQAGADQIGGTVREIRVAATWDLPRLIYNSEVLDTYALRGNRQNLLKEVIRLYYLRRRLTINYRLNPPADPASRVAGQLRIDEITATLDALTGGLYRDYAKGDAETQR